jgi:hypothetical protein
MRAPHAAADTAGTTWATGVEDEHWVRLEIFSKHMSHFLGHVYAEHIYALDFLLWHNLIV